MATAIAREVVDQVLQYEQMGRQLELLDSQIITQRHRQAVMEVGYRMGQGTTGTMLTVWQQTEDLEARRVEMAIEREQIAGLPGGLASGKERLTEASITIETSAEPQSSLILEDEPKRSTP